MSTNAKLNTRTSTEKKKTKFYTKLQYKTKASTRHSPFLDGFTHIQWRTITTVSKGNNTRRFQVSVDQGTRASKKYNRTVDTCERRI